MDLIVNDLTHTNEKCQYDDTMAKVFCNGASMVNFFNGSLVMTTLGQVYEPKNVLLPNCLPRNDKNIYMYTMMPHIDHSPNIIAPSGAVIPAVCLTTLSDVCDNYYISMDDTSINIPHINGLYYIRQVYKIFFIK